MIENKIEPRTLKGFRDFFPAEQKARQDMLLKIQNVFERFGFSPISTPALEYKEILMNKYGDDEKLVYSFEDHGGREVALRYDLTVPLARFVAENQGRLTFPFKRYHIAPVWRAENTQRGRSREFFQCDVDVVGTESPLADAEVIACLATALEAVGIKDYEVRINDRKLFNLFQNTFDGSAEQVVTVIRGIDKLEKIGSEGVINYLHESGISKKGLEQVENFLKIKDSENIFTEIQNYFEEGSAFVRTINTLLRNISHLGISADKLSFDPFIARGLDYYTGIVFEIVLKNNPEFGSITGGGRYDSLVDQYSNKPLAAVGGSIGIDRLFEALESQNKIGSTNVTKCLVLNLEGVPSEVYLDLVKKLRKKDINTEFYFETAKLDKQFKYAENKSVPFALILGADENTSGQIKIKNLETREEIQVELEKVAETLSDLLQK